jgi:hypothetical protein
MKPLNQLDELPQSRRAGEQPTLRAGAKSAPPDQNSTSGRVRRLEAIQRDAPSPVRLFQRVLVGKCSPRRAIKAQCLDCQGLDREGVRTCGDRCCPLWRFRPFAKSKLKQPAETRIAGHHPG